MIAAANICIQLCCEYLICFCCFWVAVVDLAATDGDDDGGDFDWKKNTKLYFIGIKRGVTISKVELIIHFIYVCSR